MCLYFSLPWKNCLPQPPNWGSCWPLHCQHHCRSRAVIVLQPWEPPWSLNSCHDSTFRQLAAFLTPSLRGLWLSHKNNQAMLSPGLGAPTLNAGLWAWQQSIPHMVSTGQRNNQLESVIIITFTLSELFPNRGSDKVKHHCDCCLFNAALMACYLHTSKHNEALIVLALHTIIKEIEK